MICTIQIIHLHWHTQNQIGRLQNKYLKYLINVTKEREREKERKRERERERKEKQREREK